MLKTIRSKISDWSDAFMEFFIEVIIRGFIRIIKSIFD